jgi:hypothetical protein
MRDMKALINSWVMLTLFLEDQVGELPESR